MLKVQEVSDFITEKLNEIAGETGYSFNIYAEVGESKNDGKINGILRTVNATTTPIENYVENKYTFVVEIPIARARGNSNVLAVEQIIEEFSNTYDGTNHAFNEGYGIMNVVPSKPKEFKVADNVGDCVPLFFTMEMLYTENVVTSSNKKWFLDGLAIPFLNENVIVDKEGNVRRINGKNYTETFLTGQTKFYKFQFPYQNTTLCNTLQSDLLEGKFDKTYTLTYYDGVNYTSSSPFQATVSIFKSGDTGSKVMEASMFNIMFTDVDSGLTTTKYYMALVDNPFDANTDNTRWFDSEQDQVEYFEDTTTGLIKTSGAQYEQIKAPNLNSIDITSQVYPNTKGYDLFDLTNKNYAIIKVEKGAPTDLTYLVKRFYYFVTNAQIGANNQVMFDLQLDTVQTYFIPNKDDDLVIGDCLIERASLNRFVDNGNNTVSFDGGVNSKLFEREPVQGAPKRMTKRTKMGACNTGDATFDNWMNTYVRGWVYCFLDPITGMKDRFWSDTASGLVDGSIQYCEGVKNYTKKRPSGVEPSIQTPFPVIAIPILEDGYIKINNGKYVIEPTSVALSNMFNDNPETFGDTGNSILVFRDVKISSYCPFDTAPNYTIDNNYIMNISASVEDTFGNKYPAGSKITINSTTHNPNDSDLAGWYISKSGLFCGEGSGCSYIHISKRIAKKVLADYTVDKTFTFNKNIFNSTLAKSPIYNPKLLGQDFFELKIGDETEQGYSYDLQKLNQKTISLGVTETLSPGTTKKYIRILNTTGVYIPETSESLLGFVGDNDTSLSIASSQYATMLANNKNFFAINSMNRASGLISGGATGILSLLSSSKTGVLGALGAGLSVINSLKNAYVDKMNENYTLDNLRNQPADVQLASGNAYFSAQYTEPGTYVEEYDILPAEKEVINDYMVQFGFTTNQIGQVMDYLNIRKYFNYIKAQINSISGVSMSNTARNDLRRRFAEGIRFWNSDDVDYSHENYEKWLEQVPTPTPVTDETTPVGDETETV